VLSDAGSIPAASTRDRDTILFNYKAVTEAINLSKKIFINFKFPISIKKKGKWYIASCPALDVYTQGETISKAKTNLNAAISLFITSCLERGTLDAVLKECGFVLSSAKTLPQKNNYLEVPIPFTHKAPAVCHA